MGTLGGTVRLSTGGTTTCHVLNCYRMRRKGGGRNVTGLRGTMRLNSAMTGGLVRGCGGWLASVRGEIYRLFNVHCPVVRNKVM